MPTLEMHEPVKCVDELAGEFTFIDANGQLVNAEFYVNTCDNSPQNASIRIDDYNEQLADEWTALRLEGASRIQYDEVPHNPFF